MADKFGRQKSNRWVKADKPTYGDWGDDDDYNYDDYNEEVVHENIPESSQDQEPSSPELLVNQKDNTSQEKPEIKPTNLVLSIDQRKELNFDSSDDDDDDINSSPSVVEGFDIPKNQENDIPHSNQSSLNPIHNKVSNLIPSNTTNSFDLQPPTPTYSTHQRQYSISSDPQTPLSESSFQSDNSIQHEPEHLSIKASTYIPEQINEEEDVSTPYEVEKVKTIKQPESNFTPSGKNHHEADVDSYNDWNDASSSKQPDIDSFLNDLNSSSTHKSSEMLPSLDHDVSLPDFENTSFSKYNDSEVDDTIEPLTLQKEAHDKYVSNLASRKLSVRKPISVKSDSGDYSNIVSGYGYEDDEMENESKKNEYSEQPQLNELHPVGSSGSLSTGKFSMDSNQTKLSKPPFPTINDDESRRVSQSTLNFGNWNPDTDRFRSQFINENDDELTMNYDPSKNNYDNFTNSRSSINESDQISNSSSLSIPETIDAALPSIKEDISDQDEESENKSYTGNVSILNDNEYSKPIFHEEKLTPAASKENLNSNHKTNQSQRYSSLLAPLEKERRASDSSDTNEINNKSPSITLSPPKDTRTVSNTSILTYNKDFVPQKYPVSDWKKIMTKSQPIDRISELRQALINEFNYETGLENWLHHTLKQTEHQNQIQIGKIAADAYQNAPHNDLRRHNSLRSRVNTVKDKVEGTGSSASQFGKKLFSRSKKLIRSDK